jgi:hypothetical protein
MYQTSESLSNESGGHSGKDGEHYGKVRALAQTITGWQERSDSPSTSSLTAIRKLSGSAVSRSARNTGFSETSLDSPPVARGVT